MANHQIIRAPEGTKYLKEVLTDETLPKNCIFDKVLTGCGGSYVALTSPEPYIIAVPTKSLVRDKVTSEQYKSYKVQGVSEDYPLGKRRLHLFDKIIVTYKSLPKVAEKVDISKYNLLIDEDAKQFKIPRVGLDGILALYYEDSFECQSLHPEWYAIIEKLTPEVCQKYSKNKSYLKKLYKARVAEDAVCAEDQISRIFQPGNVYTAAYIKEYLQSLNIPNAKATTLGRWYVIKRITKNGVACYRIISRLIDNL